MSFASGGEPSGGTDRFNRPPRAVPGEQEAPSSPRGNRPASSSRCPRAADRHASTLPAAAVTPATCSGKLSFAGLGVRLDVTVRHTVTGWHQCFGQFFKLGWDSPSIPDELPTERADSNAFAISCSSLHELPRSNDLSRRCRSAAVSGGSSSASGVISPARVSARSVTGSGTRPIRGISASSPM